MTSDAVSTERSDILETLTKHRGFLTQAVHGVTDEQARSRSTVSELSLGGLVKHVAAVEANWANFIVDGPGEQGPPGEADYESYAEGFRMADNETLAGLLAAYDKVA